MPTYTLSIVVPILDDAHLLPSLLRTLGEQENVELEILLCDGGSSTENYESMQSLLSASPLNVKLIKSPRGRAAQMNRGARGASHDWLLFLHVDSGFSNPRAVMLALAAMIREQDITSGAIAGHFPLCFVRSDDIPSFPYFF